ncbi:hypothetical protein ACFFRR_006691 [Megaselia abdita]
MKRVRMSARRSFFLLIVKFCLVHAFTDFQNDPSIQILSKFEVYDTLLESVGRNIDTQLIKIQNALYDIKAENSTSFECVGLYGDLFPINQLNLSFRRSHDEYQHQKDIVTDFLTQNVTQKQFSEIVSLSETLFNELNQDVFELIVLLGNMGADVISKVSLCVSKSSRIKDF